MDPILSLSKPNFIESLSGLVEYLILTGIKPVVLRIIHQFHFTAPTSLAFCTCILA